MIRPTRELTLMSMAAVVALRGTCSRKHVGAIIAREGRVISMGYNGAPPGLPHCHHESDLDETPCLIATHAEANALAFAARYGVSTEGAQLFVTVSPCSTCARLLIAAGINAVYYFEEYREGAGLDLLAEALIPFTHMVQP